MTKEEFNNTVAVCFSVSVLLFGVIVWDCSCNAPLPKSIRVGSPSVELFIDTVGTGFNGTKKFKIISDTLGYWLLTNNGDTLRLRHYDDSGVVLHVVPKMRIDLSTNKGEGR